MIRWIVFRPDITEMVDWALKKPTNYLPALPTCRLETPFVSENGRVTHKNTYRQYKRQHIRFGLRLCFGEPLARLVFLRVDCSAATDLRSLPTCTFATLAADAAGK